MLNSSYEGLPFTVLEAFAAKIPVVATNIQGTKELVSLETAWPTPSEKAVPLAQAIEDVFTHEDKAQQKVETAYALLQTSFTWEQHIATLKSFIETTKTN